MSNIIEQNDNLLSYIKSIILKNCPYVDDRLFILDNIKSPELDIEINMYDNESQVVFIFGNSTVKTSTTDMIITSYIISIDEICDIIDFIIEDHEVFKDIYFYDKRISLNFAINWSDKSIKGISCGDIGLYINFKTIDLKMQYLYMIIKKYYTYLENSSAFKAIKNDYINQIKQSYFKTLNKEELILLLQQMNEIELQELLLNLDNDVFIKYILNVESQSNEKVLLLK